MNIRIKVNVKFNKLLFVFIVEDQINNLDTVVTHMLKVHITIRYHKRDPICIISLPLAWQNQYVLNGKPGCHLTKDR